MPRFSEPLALTDAGPIESDPRRFADKIIQKLIDVDFQISRESPEYGVTREGGILPRRTVDIPAKSLSVGLLVNYTQKYGARLASAENNIVATHIVEVIANGKARLSNGFASGPILVDTAAATNDGVLFVGENGFATKEEPTGGGFTDEEVGYLIGQRQSGLCEASINLHSLILTS